MIGEWLAHWTVLAWAVATLFVPGLAIGAAFRLRGIALWALAPVGSVVLLASLAIIYGAIGVQWTDLSAAVGCLVTVVVAWLAAITLRRGATADGGSDPSRTVLVGGLVVGLILGALRLGFYIGSPDAISQTNDAVYHLNVLRFISDTGSASSFHLSGMLDSAAFYPGGWHAVTSVVAIGSGGAIPVAANMVALVIAAGVWPLGVAWLTKVATGDSATAGFAAALSPAILAFPMLMFEWGVLYPYALAVSMVPAAAGVALSLPAWYEGRGPIAGRVPATILGVVLLGAGVGALALSQPAALLAWLILVVVWFSFWTFQRLRERARSKRVGVLVRLLVVWAAAGALWLVLSRGTAGSHWAPFQGKARSLIDPLLNSPTGLPPAIGVSLLMVVGIVVAARRRPLRWLAAAWLVFAGLYIVAAAIGNPWLRATLLGAWYADPYRLGALLPIVAIPLAAVGLTAIVAWIADAITARPSRKVGVRAGAWALTAVAAVGAAGLVVAPVVQMPRIIEGDRDPMGRYESTPESYLSPDEEALLSELSVLIPAGSRVISNPATGSGFGYLLSGEDVYPRTWATPGTEEWGVIAGGLRDAADSPEICDALAAYGSPGYVLDFGPGDTTPGRFIAPGMTDFHGQPGFELVASEGEASLWRITACG